MAEEISLPSLRDSDGSDKVCINVASVLHNMAIVWKEPTLKDSTIDHHTIIMEEPFAFEETGHFASKYYRDQFAIHNFS